MKNIRRKAFDMKTLRLSPEEGFVLSRLDAPLSQKDLVSLTCIEEGRFAPMEPDKRLVAAQTEDGSNLHALCLDPDPQIIHAVLTNPKTNLTHARMIAMHHRTHVGLDAVARRSEFLSDAQVQRRLLSNP